MTKTFTYRTLTILLVLLNWTAIYAQFEIQKTYTEEDLTCVYFINDRYGYAAGTNGTVLTTRNGGRQWHEATNPGRFTINGIYFHSPDSGFIVGENDSFYKTYNGGQDWIDISPNLNGDYTAIYFVNRQKGFAIGHSMDGGIFMKTTDGGESWNPRFISARDHTRGKYARDESKDVYLTNFSFFDENTGLLSGFTYDYVIGKFPFICKTEDGGETFTDISPEVTKNDWYIGREIVSINFMNENDACAIVNSGVGSEFMLISDYSVTSFAKNNYESNFSQRGRFFSSVFLGRFIAYFTGIIQGRSQILKTIDQGGSYMFLTPPTDKSLYASFFTDHKNGYFVGQNGTILHLFDENNIVYNMASSRDEPYFDPPFTIAHSKKNKRKTQIHVYNINHRNAKNYIVELFTSCGDPIEIKRKHVRVYSDEIRIKIRSEELRSGTYFYSVKLKNEVVVNGKLDLGTFASCY